MRLQQTAWKREVGKMSGQTSRGNVRIPSYLRCLAGNSMTAAAATEAMTYLIDEHCQ